MSSKHNTTEKHKEKEDKEKASRDQAEDNDADDEHSTTNKSDNDEKNKHNHKHKHKHDDGDDNEDDNHEWRAQKHSKQPQHNLLGSEAHEKAIAQVALIVVDVINDLAFEGNEYIVEQSKVIAPTIKKLASECRAKKIPVIYCNDNWSNWQSQFAKIIQHCTGPKSAGREMSKILVPTDDDYVVIKPKHSAFYSTTLDVLLNHLKVKSVIIVGLAANICVLFTANDAYMRDYAVIVPEDCTAANTDEEKQYAFKLMRDVLKADTTKAEELDWGVILKHTMENERAVLRSKKP